MDAEVASEYPVLGLDTSLNIPAEGIATLLFLIFGLVYYFYSHHNAIPSPSPSAAPTSRFSLFVKHVISDHETVLFVTTEAYATPFQVLFNALQTPLHIVNLARTAGGAKVLDVLRERCSNEDSKEFLFVRGQLIGGSKELRDLLITGRKDELGEKCDWTHVRVDSTMDTGFMVLDALTNFQAVKTVPKEEKSTVMLETRPLHTPQELCCFDMANFVKCRVPMALHARNPRRRSKLLVCHDMKGGYLGDRFKQGCDDFDAYRFYQWDLVDVFVYFGHALVCPPPCGWIAAGHRHGTRVLGTFLTEGDDGTERCKELFQNAQSAETFALKLAAIACHGGFDGWLINIENDVPSELIVHLDLFLCILQKELHLLNPQAQIVWYGSLSRSGKRSSYVRLDECSTDFFRHVDGFYADYGWRSDDAIFSAAFDLDRRYDVYMGIDVFGRHNMLGGGMMNCSEPLRVAWNAGVSAALFAPGWTYECGQYEAKKEWVVVENRFWSALRESWKVKSPCFDALGGRNCLYTAFNVGRGNGVWLEGSRVGASPWSNLTELDIQPDHALHAGKTDTTATGWIKAVISHDTAFYGGASVQIQGLIMGREKAYFKLYDVDIEFSLRRTMEISYTIATRDDSVCLLVLTVCPGIDRATHYIILRSMDEDSDVSVQSRPSDKTKALSKVAKASKEKHFYLPICTEYFEVNIGNGDAKPDLMKDWCKKTYCLGGQLWSEKHIVEIGVLCTQKTRKPLKERKDFLAYVGEVCVIGNSGKSDANAVDHGVHSQPKGCKDVRITFFKRNSFNLVSFEVQWAFTSEGVPVRYVVVFACTQGGKRSYVGKSYDNSLWVDNCQSEETTDLFNYLTLELQSVSWAGQCGTHVCRLFIGENTRL